jgi:alpha-mannosidase
MAMFHQIRFTSEKIRQRIGLIRPLAYSHRHRLDPFRLLRLPGPETRPPVGLNAQDGEWPIIAWDSEWGQPNLDFVLRTRFRIPTDWQPGGPVALYLPIGRTEEFCHPEALAYVDGEPFATCDRYHREIRLPEQWRDGRYHLLALHGWTGGAPMLQIDPEATEDTQRWPRLRMGICQVVQIHPTTREFIALARVALDAADHLHPDDPARAHLYSALDEAFCVLDTREPFGEAFYASVGHALKTLREGVAAAGPPLNVRVTATGHAHIDVAWLWPLDQTRHKARRTFYTALRLMEQQPQFHYSQSQAQLYDMVRQDDPELFAAIQQRVQAGQWEPVGGTWVEPDCNVSGGEALVRQFLLGTAFFQEHFGQQGKSPVLWLPDVFGYPWSLPQLVKEAGLAYFFTTKLGWNQYNRFPYDSFWWQGLDGTRILVHFSPTREGEEGFASTYNATASAEAVLNTWRNFQQKDWGRSGAPPPLLMSYGYGDGGGGPTAEMLENIREMESLASTPQVHCGTAADFFQDLQRWATAGGTLPIWDGELYLEYHRGTYTTQARNKRANRKSEFLLHDAEFLASAAAYLDPGYVYPHPSLRRAWELVCLNQFHDILPGSSIGPVYEDSLRQYAEVKALAEGVRDAALQAVHRQAGGDILVVNPTPFLRRDMAFWPRGELRGEVLHRRGGVVAQSQPVEGGLLLDVGQIPAHGLVPLQLARQPVEEAERADLGPLLATPRTLENDFLRAEIDKDGDVVRLYDKRQQREILPPGAVGNQFQAFEDRPQSWDAWDIDIYYDDRMWLAEPAESIELVEAGPLRATIELRRRILNSRVVQCISLAHHSPRLDFRTIVDWQESHILLKVAFPVDVLSPTATYEIQWGNIQRPTHRNTSWDWARFEACAHKWVDLSEGGYGVSLLNDCKYGHDIRDNVLRMTLLRSPTVPDPRADLGEHRFTYSLLPHDGGWDERTVAEAYALNDPLVVESFPATAAGQEPPGEPAAAWQGDSLVFLSVDAPNVVVETIKNAEDGQGLIVRLYESQRRRGRFTLTAPFPLAEAWRTNLLEENQERLHVSGHRLELEIRPFQILTLRLRGERQSR